mgnify:FL=1
MTTATATKTNTTKKSKVKAAKCTYGRGCKNEVNTDHWLHMCDEHLTGAQALLEQQYEEHKYNRSAGWLWGDDAEDN